MVDTFLGEETAKFQEYTSINQNYWNQRVAAVEKLSAFDDGENESLEDDVRSFVDKNESSHDSRFDAGCWDEHPQMTIYTDHRHLLSYVTMLGDNVRMTRTNREVLSSFSCDPCLLRLFRPVR